MFVQVQIMITCRVSRLSMKKLLPLKFDQNFSCIKKPEKNLFLSRRVVNIWSLVGFWEAKSWMWGQILATIWSLISIGQNMAIYWSLIGQNMDFGQKLVKTWGTLIEYQHLILHAAFLACQLTGPLASGLPECGGCWYSIRVPHVLTDFWPKSMFWPIKDHYMAMFCPIPINDQVVTKFWPHIQFLASQNPT